MSLSIQRIDDFVEAHEITDEGQIIAMACLIRQCECSGDDGAEFANVAHVDATDSWIKRKNPAQTSVFLLLRSHDAGKVLIEKRCDDKSMIRKPGFLHDPIDPGFAGKVVNVELAAADRFRVGQR